MTPNLIVKRHENYRRYPFRSQRIRRLPSDRVRTRSDHGISVADWFGLPGARYAILLDADAGTHRAQYAGSCGL